MAGFENSVMVAKNINFDELGPKPHNGIINAAGKFPIGTGNLSPTPEILAGTLTSPDLSVVIGYSSPNITLTAAGASPTTFNADTGTANPILNTIVLTGGVGITTSASTNIVTFDVDGSAVVQTLTGNTGVATPVSGNINVITANTTVKFIGSGSTLTQDFSLNNLILGTNPAGLPGGNGLDNVGLGFGVLNALTSGSTNTAVGYTAMLTATTGNANCAYGFESLFGFISGNNNTAIGSLSLGSLTSNGINGNNTALGANSIQHLTTGTRNIGIGFASAQNYVTSESNNIIIGNDGVVGESNVIRLGSQGTGIGQQNQFYPAGVLNTVSGRVVKITTPGAYPYATLITDYLILVDTSSARTINPIASPVTGTTYRIKDNVGSAAANNITITPTGKNIDGAASFIINTNYGSVDIVYNGTEWSIL